MKLINIIGNRYGRLVVKKRMKNSKDGVAFWECKCDCGNTTIVSGNNLKNGSVQSCKCKRIELLYDRCKKFNKYNLTEEYGIGFDSKNKEFYFDLEDYELIKNDFWRVNKDGYVVSSRYLKGKRKEIYFHRIVMRISDSTKRQIDHEDRIKNNNRKYNLRVATQSQNAKNQAIRKENKTGIIGVSEKLYNGETSYQAAISVNNKKKYLGFSKDFEKVVKLRLEAEKKYYKEFAPQKHLFEKYGV